MKRVLIVDDEPEVVELISIVLDRDDLQLLETYDGDEALEIIRAQRPDLMITDLMMPGLDGIELCKRVKADPASNSMMIITMSARRELYSEDCGADEFIRKPFDITHVVETVDRLLAAQPRIPEGRVSPFH